MIGILFIFGNTSSRFRTGDLSRQTRTIRITRLYAYSYDQIADGTSVESQGWFGQVVINPQRDSRAHANH